MLMYFIVWQEKVSFMTTFSKSKAETVQVVSSIKNAATVDHSFETLYDFQSFYQDVLINVKNN